MLVVWAGPTTDYPIGNAWLPNAGRLTIDCHRKGLGAAPWCASVPLGTPEGLAPGATLPLVLAAFSAGGDLYSRALARDDFRRAARAVYLADAAYSVDAFAAYATLAATDPSKLFVATVSQNGGTKQNLYAIKAAVEKATGQKFVLEPRFFRLSVQPRATWRLGNVWLAEYDQAPLGHAHTKLAAEVFRQIIAPHVQGSRLGRALVGLGVSAVFGVALWLTLRR